MGRHLIGELLVSGKIITREQLDEALATPRSPGKKIGHVLLERGWITESQLTQTLSLQLGVPWVSLYHIDFSRQLLNLVPREMAEKYCMIPIFVRHVKGQGETLYVATDDPKNETALSEVSRAAHHPTRPMIASPQDIRSAIRVYYFDGDGAPSTDPLAGVPSTTRENTKPAKPPPPGASPGMSTGPSPPAASVGPATPHAPPAPPLRPISAPPPPQALTPHGGPPPAPAVRHSSAPPPPSFPPPPGGGNPRASKPRMVALTLLDGTTLQLPARDGSRRDSIPPSVGGVAEGLTARDLVSALRAVSHGADASEILGDQPQWEPIIAALMSVLLKKGIIADWEFIEEYRKI